MQWRVVHDERPLPPQSRRPPFVTVNVEVPEFEFLGSRGLLELHFLNDRLASVLFSPPDPERVFEAMSRMPGAVQVSDAELRVAPATVIRLLTFAGRTRLIARDDCLEREAEDWIKRYAALGYPAGATRPPNKELKLTKRGQLRSFAA